MLEVLIALVVVAFIVYFVALIPLFFLLSAAGVHERTIITLLTFGILSKRRVDAWNEKEF